MSLDGSSYRTLLTTFRVLLISACKVEPDRQIHANGGLESSQLETFGCAICVMHHCTVLAFG
jgi:hypothetical protein